MAWEGEDLSSFVRRVPHDVGAEMSMLGAMLVNSKAVATVRQFLPRADALALAENRVVYQAIIDVCESGGDVNPVAVKHRLGSTVLLDGVGGPAAYLNRLVDCAVTVINAGEYARIIADYAMRREMIGHAEDLLRWSYGEATDAPVSEMIEAIGRCRDHSAARTIGLHAYRMQDLDKIYVEPKRPLLGSWLHRQSKAFISGGDKTGKSFLTLEVARAAATGLDFLHWSGSGERANVLYVDGEMGLLDLKRRRQFMADRNPDFGNLVIASFDKFAMPPLETEEGQRWVIAASKEIDANLVILDNWTMLTRVSLSDDDAVKSIIPMINALLAMGCGILCVLHTGHDKSRYLGTSVIGGLTTGIVHLTRDEDSTDLTRGTVEFQSTRDRDPDDPDYRTFNYVIERGGQFMEDSGARRGSGEPMKREHRWAMEQFRQCVENFGVVKPGSSIRPPNLSCLKVSFFIEWLGHRMPSATEEWCKKTLRELIVAGHLAADADLIWEC